MRYLLALCSGWTWRMAWRDSRRARTRLFVFVTSMTVGVASLVAITSFGDNLRQAVNAQARDMLGADLRIRSRQEFSPEVQARLKRVLIEQQGGTEARQISFSSMALFPDSGDTRLVQVRALSGEYPFYGELLTEPPSAAESFRTSGRALVDAALLSQFGAGPGDPVRIGSYEYRIAGALKRIPGESATSALFGPRVYIPLDRLDPELLVRGSRLNRAIYYRFDARVEPERLKDDLSDFARENQLRIDTVESTQERLGRSMENLYGFLNLVGFFALILGALGVGSAINVYVRQKVGMVATLRCLGARAHETLSIYLAQALILGLFGAILGALIGLGVQQLIPRVLAELMPMEVEVELSIGAVLTGLGIGLSVSLAFALLPLLPLRNVPPRRAFSAAIEPTRTRDHSRSVIMLLIGLMVFGFAWSQSGRPKTAFIYTLGLAATFVALALSARLLRHVARHRVPFRLPFEWRQGLANLYRPNNQTLLLMVSIGFGAFLIVTLDQTRALLLGELELAGGEDQPNVVLFDIQDDQLEPVEQHVRDLGLPIDESVPIVNMHLQSVRGRTAAELRADGRDGVSGWAVRREYRSTYRDQLRDTEELIAGTFTGRADPSKGPVPISLEQRVVDDLDVELGDELVWDVQGVSVPTVVGSIRKVDWRRMRPNFFAVFPAGVLEQAPKFHVVVTRAGTPEKMGELQRTTLEHFPNVSTIDVTMILEVAQELISRISFVIRFMSLFSILTGLLVLISTVLTSRFQRLEEGLLLRTLGASRRTVSKIMNVEYLLLGSLATLTGVILSIAGSYGLAVGWFDLSFHVAWPALIVCLLVITGLTMLVGKLGSIGMHSRAPMESLREVLRSSA